MQRKFRAWKFGVCLLLILGASPFLGFDYLQAKDFPTKPIELVVPFAAGGSSELQARTFAHHGKKHLGQPLVIQIRAGGQGSIGSELVAAAKPDGYTLLHGYSGCNTGMVALQGLSKGPDDLAPVIMIAKGANFYWVQASSPFNNLKDVVAWAKAHPGELTFGNPGVRGGADLIWQYLENKAGFTSRVVPFPGGGGPAMMALLGGHVMVAGLATAQAMPQMRAGKLKAIACIDVERHPDFPNIPTMGEQGFESGIRAGWRGILAPKKTPKPIIDKLYAGFKKMFAEPDTIDHMNRLGERFMPWGPEQFGKYWQEEFKFYQELAKTFPLRNN